MILIPTIANVASTFIILVPTIAYVAVTFTICSSTWVLILAIFLIPTIAYMYFKLGVDILTICSSSWLLYCSRFLIETCAGLCVYHAGFPCCGVYVCARRLSTIAGEGHLWTCRVAELLSYYEDLPNDLASGVLYRHEHLGARLALL